MWNITYIGKIFENCSALTNQLAECSQPRYGLSAHREHGGARAQQTIYNDAAFTYDIEPIRANVTLGVQNVFNQ